MRTRDFRKAAWLLALLVTGTSLAQTPTPPTPAPGTPPAESAPTNQAVLDTVSVVAGSQPGPRLWTVRKGEHVLHVLATVSPLPRGIAWDAARVEGVIARSQEYIRAPYLAINADVGLFGGLSMLPAYLRAQKNPGGATLRDVLSPALYTRWSAAKTRYLPNDRSVEGKRPMLAATELYRAAQSRAGLGGKPIVTPVIDAAVKRHGLKVTRTAVVIQIDNPRAALKEVQGAQLNDAQCLVETLDAIDRKLPDMVRQANAWATGDTAALRAQPSALGPSCFDAISETAFARKRGIHDVEARMRANWLSAAETALQRNASTFAILPLDAVSGPKSYLAALRAKGYEVVEP